jgi:glycosyltransferase involved in cell wall biosynthesis
MAKKLPAQHKNNADKIKLLIHSDFLCTTGFAQVAENLVKRLIATGRYDITVIGINYYGEPYDHTVWPITVYPAIAQQMQHETAYQDFMGRQRVLDELAKGEYDILWTQCDPEPMKNFGGLINEVRRYLVKSGQKPFVWTHYFPVDSYLRDYQVESLKESDLPICYTEFGVEEINKIDSKLVVGHIPLGVDTKIFYPMSDTEIKKAKQKGFGGLFKDKFVVLNVNRNQRRKGLHQTIAAFALFKKLVANAFLWIHARLEDPDGGDFRFIADFYGLKEGIDWAYPAQMPESGLSHESMNALYNVADVVLTTSQGEGWGLSLSEAMATMTPIVGSDNTSISEILADGRGVLVPCDSFSWWGNSDRNIVRPVVNVEETAEALLKVHSSDNNKMVERAFRWVQTIDWDLVADLWEDEFLNMMVGLEEYSKKTTGVNDLCPICSANATETKFKKCKKHYVV